MYAKYESPTSQNKQVIANVKVFEKLIKGHRQCHMFKRTCSKIVCTEALHVAKSCAITLFVELR